MAEMLVGVRFMLALGVAMVVSLFEASQANEEVV